MKGIHVPRAISNTTVCSLGFSRGVIAAPAKKCDKASARKKWATLFLGAALSVLLPLLVFQGVDVARTWSLILDCNAMALALGGLFFLGTLWFRSWRWRFLLAAQQNVPVGACLSATSVGLMANNLLPFRLGDLVRVGALRQLQGGSAARILGSVAVERILEILTLVFFLGGYLALAGGGAHQGELLTAGILALAGGLFLAAVLVVGYWRRSWLQRVLAAPPRWISPKIGDKVEELVGRFLEGLQVFGTKGQVARVLALSICLWGCSVGSYFLVGQSLGLDIPPEAFVVVVFTTTLGAIIPAAPGAVGTFHSFAFLGLYLVGVTSGEAALAFAALLHAVEWSLLNVAGLFFLWRDRLHLAATPEGRNDATPQLAPCQP